MLLQLLLLLLVCLAAQSADAAGFAAEAYPSRSRVACRDWRLQQVTAFFSSVTSLKVHNVDDGRLHGRGTEMSCVEAISDGFDVANGAMSSTAARGRNRHASRSASPSGGGYAYVPTLRRRRGSSNRRLMTPDIIKVGVQSPFERSALLSSPLLMRRAPTGAVRAGPLNRRVIWCLKSLRDDQAIMSEKLLAELRPDGSTATAEDDASAASAARSTGAEANADVDKQIDKDAIDSLKRDIENVRRENEALLTENKLLKRVTGDLIGNLRDLAELLGELDDCRLEANERVEQTLYEAAEQFPEDEELSSYEWLTKR